MNTLHSAFCIHTAERTRPYSLPSLPPFFKKNPKCKTFFRCEPAFFVLNSKTFANKRHVTILLFTWHAICGLHLFYKLLRLTQEENSQWTTEKRGTEKGWEDTTTIGYTKSSTTMDSLRRRKNAINVNNHQQDTSFLSPLCCALKYYVPFVLNHIPNCASSISSIFQSVRNVESTRTVSRIQDALVISMLATICFSWREPCQ